MYIYDLWIPLMIILMVYSLHTGQITTLSTSDFARKQLDTSVRCTRMIIR